MLKKISVLVPMYNEQEVVETFFAHIIPVVEQLAQFEYEMICVNDGSRDQTYAALLAMRRKNAKIKVVNLSRNFGKESALTAALDFASGDVVIPIDADLQDPPELIPKMIALWESGYDIVNAVRRDRRSEHWVKRVTARMFYRVFSRISDVEIPENVGDFRLLSKRACNELKKMKESRRFMKGLFAWIGFPTATIEYERRPRVQGKTKWNYWKLWNFAIEGIVSFSTAPLKIATYFGFLVATLSFLYALYFVLQTLLFGNPVDGYPSLMTAVLFFGGAQIMFIGIIGEYIGRIHDEAKNRPVYIIEKLVGFEEDPPADREPLTAPRAQMGASGCRQQHHGGRPES